VISQGLTLAQIKARIRKEERGKGRDTKENDSCVAALVEVEDVEAQSTKEVLEDWFGASDQGEWHIPSDD
jgi:hypothetical protein